MNIYNNYGLIDEDDGYKIMFWNRCTGCKIPYTIDIDPRLVRYLRTLYYYKKYNIIPCIPLEIQFWITKRDIVQMGKYMRNYINKS